MTIDVYDVVYHVTQLFLNQTMSFLLARVTDESDLPDDYYSFVQQFTYWQGSYASQLDTESLMILLWQMDKRIKELEANQSNL